MVEYKISVRDESMNINGGSSLGHREKSNYDGGPTKL